MFRLAPLLLLVWLACAGALRLVAPTRRQVLAAGTAALASPLAPAFAKSKKTVSPNKPEGMGLDPVYRKNLRKEQETAMVGDKGSRGTVYDQDFEKLEMSRVARASTVTSQSRNPRPEDLGLKQWDGN